LLFLASLFPPRFLCFHQLAASFAKTPGVWVPLRHLRVLCAPALSFSPRVVSKGSLSLIDFLTLCFHNLANCFSRNSFRLITICVAPCLWGLHSLYNPVFSASSACPGRVGVANLPVFLFTLDFVPRTKYCSTANCCSRERGL
jgi:hypothetical protein